MIFFKTDYECTKTEKAYHSNAEVCLYGYFTIKFA